jgi:hypothetical protein
MKQNDVHIGMQARIKIGSRLAAVTVLREIDMGGHKARRRFECRTSDTGRLVKATAARLRPMPAVPVDGSLRVEQLNREAEVEREAAWQRGRAAALAAWASCPVGAY